MTPERARAYQRVTKTLRELGPIKLLPIEEDRIRHAADQLIFVGDDPGGQAVEAALADIECLCRELADSGRWDRDRAMRLADDVYACGPPFSSERLVA